MCTLLLCNKKYRSPCSFKRKRTFISLIGVRAPLDLRGRRPYCPKKITQCPKECVVQTHSNRSKTKTLPILTSNERIIIPKSEFFEPQRETKIGSKNRIFREIRAN